VRLSGASRFETTTAVSNSYWKTKGDAADHRHVAKAVVLSRSDTFADALGGSSLAAAKEGPLLLTPPNALEPSALAEIDRVLDPGDPIYLLGGTGALSQAVEDALKVNYTTIRLADADRYGTAVKIAKAIDASPELILVATGNNFPDALGAGAAAGSYDVPGVSDLKAVVVLTADATLPKATKDYIDSLPGGLIYTVGHQADNAIQPVYGADLDRVQTVAGEDRYATAFTVAYTFFASPQQAGIATGDNWPDALAGGALMGTLNGPLLLPPGLAAKPAAAATWYLSQESASLDTTVIFGGTGVVSNAQLSAVGGWISGPGGFTTAGTVVFPASLAAPSGLRAAPQSTGDGVHRTLQEMKAAAQSVRKMP